MTYHEMFCQVDVCGKLLAQQACRLINSGTSSTTQEKNIATSNICLNKSIMSMNSKKDRILEIHTHFWKKSQDQLIVVS